MDWGLQSIVNGNPVLVKPLADLSSLEWADSQNINNYSMMGSSGAGVGSLTVNGYDGAQFALLKSTQEIDWVYHLKGNRLATIIIATNNIK